MRRAVAVFALATVIVGALQRGFHILLGWSVLPQEVLVVAVIGAALGLLALSPRLAEQGVWPYGEVPTHDAGLLVTRVATVVIALTLGVWMFGRGGLWLLPGDDNAAWLRIASTSSLDSVAPVDQGVAVAMLLTLAVGVSRVIFWCVRGVEGPWEIFTWSVVGAYGALAVTLPNLAHRAFRRRSEGIGDFGGSVLLVQVSVTAFSIEAIRLGHLTALLLCVGLIASLPRARPIPGARLQLVRWTPFACCLSIWLGTVPLSLALLGAIIVAALVSSTLRSTGGGGLGRLVAVALGVVVTAYIGRKFSRLLPWGGSVAEIHWPTILALFALVILALIRQRSLVSVLTIVSGYASVLVVANLWKSGSIDYGVSKIIWILVPLVLLEVLARLGPESIQSLSGRASNRSGVLPRSFGVVVVTLSVLAVSWSAIPAFSIAQQLGSAQDVPDGLHWRDLGGQQARSDLPVLPLGCFAIDSRHRPVLTSEALYRCNRFVTASLSGSANVDDRLGQAFRAYASGGLGPGGLLETIGSAGVRPSRILVIDDDGQLISTPLRDIVR